jgi:uncharacterized protein
MEREHSYTAFAGVRQVAAGPLQDVLPVLKQRFDRDMSETVLVFGDESGRPFDFDLRGPIEAILEREIPSTPRGPGRPRLGVKSKEVSLLPRHWDWLDQQPNGLSSALRRLVAQAIKAQPGGNGQRIRDGLSQVLSAIAGDRPNFEEVCRALFARDSEQFESLVKRWPKDIRAYALRQMAAAAAADNAVGEATGPRAIIADLYRLVWSKGDYAAIDRLIAPAYVIHSDPGDAWDGQTLDRAEYRKRVVYSRTAFPDLVFAILEMVAAEKRVCVRWTAEGTQRGDLDHVPATGKRLTFCGHTTYEVDGGQVRGHWQIVDRLGFAEQLR